MSGNCSTSTWTSLIAAHASYSVFSLANPTLLSNSVHCFRNHVQFYLSLKGRPCITFSVTPMFFSMDINTLFLCISMTEMAVFLLLVAIRAAFCFCSFSLNMNVACGELFRPSRHNLSTKHFTTYFKYLDKFSRLEDVKT